MTAAFKAILLVAALGGAAALGWLVYQRVQERETGSATGEKVEPPAPVEVAAIERGPLTLRRTFSGSLEATESFVVAAKVGGRLKKMDVHLTDTVKRGSTVAWLDDDEYQQNLAQAKAELEVAKANVVEAESSLEIADRAFERTKALETRGVESESQLDLAIAEQLSKKARFAVTKAHVTRAEAAVKAEDVRLSYTRVVADWPGEDEFRVVGDRYVDEGETVTANTPLLTIIRLDPILGVVYVPERDYARLEPGQAITLRADAYPGEPFEGKIKRIASVFRQNTRQARVELSLANPQQRLKPGMFARVTIELAKVEDATIVPIAALTKRNEKTGVFLVDQKGEVAVWREVEVGIREGDRVQVTADGLTGRVVTLGQQLIDDGSPITIPDDAPIGETKTTTTAE
jgi:RND family efflux transporter MFP subunit